MASGSSYSSMFVGTGGIAGSSEPIIYSQQGAYPVMPTSSLVHAQYNHLLDPNQQRNQQGEASNADLVAVVVSPTTLVDDGRFVCEICSKGFAREQNLLLHQKGHNIPYTLKKRTPNNSVAERKVYLCPESTCIHHNRSHAIRDFGGLRKHYLRKHCVQKKYKCDTCPKAYSIESDLKAHSKICKTRNGTIRNNICHGSGFSRGRNFAVHHEIYDEGEYVAAPTNQQALHMGDSSVERSTNNRNIPIGSTMSYPQMLGMGDNTIITNSNVNSSTFIAPQITSIQNQYNSYPSSISAYQSQLRQFGADHSSDMTYPSMGLDYNEIPNPAFYSPISTHQNQQGCKENYDIQFYADQLTDEIPFGNVNLEMGNCGNVYGSGEGFMFDPSSSHNFTPAYMHNLSLNGMMNPVTGSTDVGSSEQGVYNGQGVGMEAFNFEHQPQQENQPRVWY